MSEKLETTLDEQGVVTKNAKPGDPMPKSETGTPGQGLSLIHISEPTRP